MDASRQELIEVLRGAVALLALPGNDFAWSRWDDDLAAIGDLNGLISSLESGQTPRRSDVSILFAPTGSIQEVSMSSGWAYEFLALSKRFDAAEERFYGPREDGKQEV